MADRRQLLVQDAQGLCASLGRNAEEDVVEVGDQEDVGRRRRTRKVVDQLPDAFSRRAEGSKTAQGIACGRQRVALFQPELLRRTAAWPLGR